MAKLIEYIDFCVHGPICSIVTDTFYIDPFTFMNLGHLKKYTCLASPPASFLGAASYFILFFYF